MTFDQIKKILYFSVGFLNEKYNCISLKICELPKRKSIQIEETELSPLLVQGK